MIIYGALLIPIIVAFVLYKFFRHETVWWEFTLPVLASIIFTFSAKALIEYSQVQSKEYWGSFIQRIEYYEDWDEWITQTCTRSCCCDADGNNCSTETYDCSYCLYHPPVWQIVTTTDETVSISEGEYNRLKGIYSNETFSELSRDYYTDDGDEYSCAWQNDSLRAIPVTTLHYYENRVKVADQSVFHFREVDTADIRRFNLKEYPNIVNGYEMDALIGDNSPDAKTNNKKFKYLNALLGHKKEVRILVLLFQNQSVEAGLYQEWHWSGANMNEFVVTIGIDKERNVKWCHPFSWTRAEQLKADVKYFVQNQKKLDLGALAGFMGKEVDRQFQRRDFAEFDYLTIEPPTWTVVLTYFLTICLNLGISLWIIRNEYEDDDDGGDSGDNDRKESFFDRIRRIRGF